MKRVYNLLFLRGLPFINAIWNGNEFKKMFFYLKRICDQTKIRGVVILPFSIDVLFVLSKFMSKSSKGLIPTL